MMSEFIIVIYIELRSEKQGKAMEKDILNSPGIIKDFLIYMQTIKGKSPLTVSEYYIDLRTFFRYILKKRGKTPVDIEFEDITLENVDLELVSSVTLSDIYEYLYYISNERKNNALTRSRKISCLRSYYKYICDKMGLIKENPTKNLETPKKKKTLPKHLSLEESMNFLSTIDGDYRARDFCIMTIFLNCGLRLSELCGLNLKDISVNSIKVLGKGNKERIVYLNEACINAINEYLKVRPCEGVKDKNALFISRLKSRISPKTVQWIVKSNLEKSGLSGKGFSTHKLRHTAATLMYQHGGVDIRVLQQILGHESLSTTEIYTHLSSMQLEQAAKDSPLAKYKVKRDKQKN
jgi:site-specific recombinase XerD